MRYVFFSPYVAVWPHTKIESELAISLNTLGHHVEFMRCKGLLSCFCLAMPAYSLKFSSEEFDKKRICTLCKRTNNFLNSVFEFKVINLEDCLAKERIEFIDAWIQTVSFERFDDIFYDGVNIGKLSSYEFILHNKLQSLILQDSLIGEFKCVLRNAVFTYEAAKSFFSRNKVDSVIVYNEFYSTNRVFCHVARNFSVRIMNIQAAGPLSDMYSYIRLNRTHDEGFSLSRSDEWLNFSRSNSNPKIEKKIINHYRDLLDAKSYWVYSSKFQGKSPKDIKDFFCIENTSRVIVVALSSEDEFLARNLSSDSISAQIQTNEYIVQTDWIKHILSIAKRRSDLHFIIRFHPRMFSNKREDVPSSAAFELLQLVRNHKTLKNISVNLPTDNISIYELAPVTDLVLNNISSVGYEFVGLGIPSLSHEPTLSTYPKTIGYHCDGFSNYEREIENAIRVGVPLNMIKETYLWISFRFYFSNIQINRTWWKLISTVLKPFRIFSSRIGVNFFDNIARRTINILFNLGVKPRKSYFNLKTPSHETDHLNLVKTLEILEKIRKTVNIGTFTSSKLL